MHGDRIKHHQILKYMRVCIYLRICEKLKFHLRENCLSGQVGVAHT